MHKRYKKCNFCKFSAVEVKHDLTKEIDEKFTESDHLKTVNDDCFELDCLVCGFRN